MCDRRARLLKLRSGDLYHECPGLFGVVLLDL